MIAQVIPRPRSLSLANPDATYLIAGGLGGIGRALAVWMIDKGSKNIILVSRNAESHANAAELVRTAKAEGCNLLVRNCDVSSESDLAKLLAYCCSASLPPIRGAINCAMVLDVRLHPLFRVSVTSPTATLTRKTPLAGHGSGTHDIRTMATCGAGQSLQ